jgi:hypothetical protein
MQNLVQQKAEIAGAIGASGAVVTWIEQANQWVDLGAGVMAIVASGFAIAWYIKQRRDANGNTRKPTKLPADSSKTEPRK